MKIKRKFSSKKTPVYDLFKYSLRTSILKNPDGSDVFKADNIEVPEQWSQVATDIITQKYFRKTGVPQYDAKGNELKDKSGNPILGSENSAKQVVHRIADTWRHWGESQGYFDEEEDADAFYDELAYMLLNQTAAPNSPQWFNTGLYHSYDIAGSKQGHYYVDPDTKELVQSENAYSHPQPHACFIQSVEDDLIGEGGIFDLALREARIFKYGSGSGTNFSNIRGSGEKLSGGGSSSGLMSFLKIFDRAAGAIKSGGTTRRAAKMVIINIDHPDVEEFIEWKAKEEEKVASLVSGSKINATFMRAITDEAIAGGTDRTTNKQLNSLIKKSIHRGLPLVYIQRVLDLIDQGFTNMDFEEIDSSYEGEGYNTVSGQNSNNSVRVTADFMKAVEKDATWDLIGRTNKEVIKTVKARDLWAKVNMSAWKSADPGLQFDTTINEWHTCPEAGRINASNPCSEYMFLDDTACNLASLNLMKFYNEETSEFLVDDFLHAVRIWTVVLEISVLMAQFPSKKMAQLSYDFRTLGLGYANIGALLMVNGIPYDSPEGLAIAGSINAMLTGQAYCTSAEMAQELGTFNGFEANKEHMLRVIRNHRRAAYNVDAGEYESLSVTPTGIDSKYCPDYMLEAARKVWDKALKDGTKNGFRNAQVSVIAPTGTIGLVMDCDTTGIEPDFAVVKYKKLAGGGYFKIVNQSVPKALKKLGYSEDQIEDIANYSKGRGSLVGCPTLNIESLKEKGFGDEQIEIIESQLPNVFDVKFAFNKWALGEEFCVGLGLTAIQLDDPTFSMLESLGYSKRDIEIANDYICGTMMIEGAPHINDEHLAVFDTANKCGRKGKRYIDYMAHVRMMAAAQPFISGAISKTVNMPAESSVADVGKVYTESWKMMVKAIALYRDGSKLSQPLNSAQDEDLDETVLLGDEYDFDPTVGPEEYHNHIAGKLKKQKRKKLPMKRSGFIREARVGGHKVFLRTGEYEDGSLGEIFIDMYKEGASFKGLLNTFAVLASKALQYGVPLEELVDSFTFTRFEPAGPVFGHEAIKSATSILDYVFRSIGYDYLGRTDFVHVKAVDEIANGKNGKHGVSINGDGTAEIIEVPESAEVVVEDKKPIEQENSAKSKKPEIDKSDAVKFGYTGEQCLHCGSIRVKRNGNCTLCEDCGETSGCS
ncbi:MAG: vitamin B12-dependent ribonucleotide reductase [Candidatus Kapabacteria bacterium]|jgi:ribonucleoside-diphosphate reductase alpha chain|nr:vitamin B12-dependent ribonucleotide reductase [Candidatus Kapabacteria bacterium]